MKADQTAQTALLDLQAQDALIAQLQHRKKTLPEIAQIAELEVKFKQLDGQRIEHDTAVSDLSRAQKKADAEVEQVKTRRTRDEERLNSGAISNPKDLSSLQHELVALERRIGTLEDEELEVMQKLEEAQARLRNAEGDLEVVRGELDRKKADRDAALTAIEQQLAGAEEERTSSAAALPTDLIALYDKIRSQYGVGAAALRARRCEGCRLELNGADLREIASAPEDEVLRCPECSRILVRTPESGL
ncbi:zinc ribbon domain-containing protein [Aeromicrobium wangtongii]|uniref:C4-type zinc ribbon domain-containing protein n=1 Tax=Aeromicrobium wangtongii TaxID=2969247 RepID=A0ABY5M9U8_9ACTN|nr:C4-type zinc ribbon domain-containing protein [Aeromicrobium wangtongii]MCD9197416.1 C4-type zinc ribbon domain-containing protein [Aeromicrobium wangtongii]UUP14910.1 C4-type zinc ribbon domain-containing protein [Aeromicrobium wangtongii]